MKTAIIDGAYGDVGKGRVCAYFVQNADWSIKFNGGPNSGHTVYDANGTKYKLHHLSAGSVYGKKVAIDSGSVVNLSELKRELDDVQQFGHNVDLYISENVHLIQTEHLAADSNGSGVGSTKRGMAYVYADRALRKGKRITKSDLDYHNIKATIYRGLPPIQSGENAVFEGSQGVMLDVDYGDYPYVTSSSVMPSSAHRIDKFIGVFKAYTTRVGDGPPYYPDLEFLRAKGAEYGATTGRARKCTWNDIDQLNYAFSIIQPDEIVVTKLDILEGVDICVYKDNALVNIGTLDNYKNFLLDTFPQIKWFSESPSGNIIKAR